MIILRQKNYSSPLTNALYGKEKLVSGIKKSAARLRTNLTRAVSKSPLSPKVIAAQELERKAVIEGKAAKRKAIQSKNKIKAVKNYIGTSTPGQIASDAVGEVIRRPVFVGGAVGGYAPLAYGVYVPVPTTAAALALEEGVRKIVPGYAKATDSLSKAYNKSGKKVVSNLVDSATKAIL